MTSQSRFCVYLITNNVNGKVYVGKTRDVRERWRQHLYEARCLRSRRTHTSPIYLAINKHGENAFSIEPIEWCDTEEDCFAAEVFWIQWYRSSDGRWGYNASLGGEGSTGHRWSAESRAKQSARLKGRKQSPEFAARRTSMRIGSKHRPESIEKMRAAKVGKKLTDDRKKKAALGGYSLKAKKAGLTLGEYMARLAQGDVFCTGLSTCPPHWTRESELAANRSACKACVAAYARAIRAKANVTQNVGTSARSAGGLS